MWWLLVILFNIQIVASSHAMVCEGFLSPEPIPPSLKTRFEAFYVSNQIDPRLCGPNIDGFIKYLRDHHELPNDFKRVVIRTKYSRWHLENMLIAVNTRFGTLDPSGQRFGFWYHHVIGIVQNQVYDFHAATPAILSFQQYLENMFVPKVPFMVFGDTFRVGGRGPYYGPQDAREELSNFTFEIDGKAYDLPDFLKEIQE